MAMSIRSLSQIQKKAIEFSSNEIQHYHVVEYVIPQFGIELSFAQLQAFQHSDKAINSASVHSSTIASIQELFLNWLATSQSRVGLLLGDYGMGKTISCMNLTHHLLSHIKEGNVHLPIPIYLDLRLISGKQLSATVSIHSILDSLIRSTQRSGETEYGVITADDLIDLVRNQNALILFDGLDEVLIHLSRDQGKEFVYHLLEIIPKHQKDTTPQHLGHVLLSCRTHFFKNNNDQHHFLFSSRPDIFDGVVGYKLFVMQPLAEHQVKDYLEHLIPDIDIETLLSLIRSVHNLVELSQRPYTLSLIPHLIPSIQQWNEEGSLVKGVTIYRHLVLSLLDRDIGKHKLIPEHKMILLERFAADLWRSGKNAWTMDYLEAWFSTWIHTDPTIRMHYFNDNAPENSIGLMIELLLEDLISATLLIRIGDSYFRFAHTSLLEFFLASYLYNALILQQVEHWALPLVSKETLDFLGQLLSESSDDNALLILRTMLDKYRPKISELAFCYLIHAFDKSFPIPSTTRIQLDGADLENCYIHGKKENELDLTGISFKKANLKNAVFVYVNLSQANFSEADCTNSEFSYCCVAYADFQLTNFKSGFTLDSSFEYVNFNGVNLEERNWVRCAFEGAEGLDSKSYCSLALFDLCTPKEQYNCLESNSIFTQGKNIHAHQSVAMGCRFSRDGQTLITASMDRTMRLWDIKTKRCLKLFKQDHSIYDCTITSDSKYALSASADSNLYLWDIESEECLRILRGHTGITRGCNFSSDNQICVSASHDRTVRLWGVESSECLYVFEKHQTQTMGCKFSPSNSLIASASEDGIIYIWDSISGKTQSCLKGHTGYVRSLAFTTDAKLLISCSGDKTIRLWDVESGRCISVLHGHTDKIRGCAISPDDRYIISASFDKTLRVWDIKTGECVKVLTGHKERIRVCDVSADGVIASSSDDLTIRFWDINTGESVGVIG